MDFSHCFRFALLTFFFPVGNAAQPATPSSTNVVFITIDTLRPDHLGCYGDKQIGTPNIDALAADGTRFERAYTAVLVTLPSHTVIFTGTYPMLSGVHDFAANKLSPTQATLASVLKDNGYTTGRSVSIADDYAPGHRALG
jgi:arylsulfatase A-like enzyme